MAQAAGSATNPPPRGGGSRRPAPRNVDRQPGKASTGPSPLPARFYTPEEVADLFGVPLETVYQWRRKRTGPPGFRVGRHLRYDPAALATWVANQTQEVA